MADHGDTRPVDDNSVDQAVAEGGAYDIIRRRLSDQAKTLNELTLALNQARTDEFGASDMSVIGRVRVRTENNCTARDIVQVGQHLLFGYNVFIGLKKETEINDVFALFSVHKNNDQFDIVENKIEGSFLTDPAFVNDFHELYRYYKNTKLIQLRIHNGKLLAGFQIGERIEDVRVFRWLLAADGSVKEYIDNRGERDLQLPSRYDFEWVATTRDDTVQGRHPHINVLNTLFLETINGTLTIKVENNTESGLGIYEESVEEKSQSLNDAEIHYAEVGDLILLDILPYREQQHRYFVFNRLTEQVLRLDAIGQSCVQLPEDHGLIFPGGYYLRSGEHKTFDQPTDDFQFKRSIRSPNGEDMLYVFYEPEEGIVGLLSYNLIDKKIQNPIFGHGYALADDGQVVIFSAEKEPTRVHPMQIWNTPFVSDEFASAENTSQTELGKIGNAELVRGVSDLYSIGRLIANQQASTKVYEEIKKASLKLFDDYYWMTELANGDIEELLKQIAQTAELVLDEFEKVQSIREQSTKAMVDLQEQQRQLVVNASPESWRKAQEYVDCLQSIRKQRGKLISVKELRYIDLNAVDNLSVELDQIEETINHKTVEFLSTQKAFDPYKELIEEFKKETEKANTVNLLNPIVEKVENTASGLDLLSELMATLKIDDATVRTEIIDNISQIYALLNQCKASARNKSKNLGSEEAKAQFSAQFKLFSQSISNALGLADSPEKCDENLSRVLVQLEEIESQFGEFDEFLTDILSKREEVYESFESQKQQLLQERQRRAQSLADAATRMLSNIEKRSMKFTEVDELNTYFASDALNLKIREISEQLREMDESVKSDDIDSKYKSIKEQAVRGLRDKSDIYEDGGSVIKLGPRHKFSVNTQELDLTILPREDQLYFHLTGTNYYQRIDDEELISLQTFWSMSLESETPQLYRAEYLAYSVIRHYQQSPELSLEALIDLAKEETALLQVVKEYGSARYREGYEKGIHDADAVRLLISILPMLTSAGHLKYDPLARAIAQIFWANFSTDSNTNINDKTQSIGTWQARAASAKIIVQLFNDERAIDSLTHDIVEQLRDFYSELEELNSEAALIRAANYLVDVLASDEQAFVLSKHAKYLVDELKRKLDSNTWQQINETLSSLQTSLVSQWQFAKNWLVALVRKHQLDQYERYIPETIAYLISANQITIIDSNVDTELTVDQLLGEHATIVDQALSFSLDDFLSRNQHHVDEVIPNYTQYLKVRQSVIDRERKSLRLHEFKPRPLSSFVRNKLINDAYLPVIGDNLAKQMGTVGSEKRTDLMGLLMMISPPGYGKTTLMEYVASRLGLIFMKINCPSLGHSVISLDPSQAGNATAGQELEKLNLALEMGNNVMLYLDDIQHTHPEFLQKFISLCDGTRRIEGVWKGNTKTYDMRGKKFCVVMAGNPYTESGEVFKIPDMLANRADIYNLGDILGGMDEQFALSYIENSLTSNPVLAPLALRSMSDIYKLIDMAKGVNIAASELEHQYSGAEINEIVEVLKKMLLVQSIVLRVNQQYIISAAQDDKYRTEPPFKLQGSYRNMNKMTEKISSVMNSDELDQMIRDHYIGEAQLLTTGAEANLLKLNELRGTLADDDQQRWQQIKADFLRNKSLGDADGDTGNKVVAQLYDLVNIIESIKGLIETKPEKSNDDSVNQQLALVLKKLASQSQPQNLTPEVNIVNEPVPGLKAVFETLASTIENSLMPLMKNMDKKLDIDLRTHEKLSDLADQVRNLKLPSDS
ncbi:DNA repair ATPase [Sessilibacter corallicola]|uniref:DNA repair ATPase n=1 Tax=Sessilibacter corallicola TaxID=2904075 RepID=UPI001E5C3192|nr:DNA repair ATPase [Sessilibacter corallicola]MCE2030535.1 DNA repair ATPase [Sessilibacter corallicola]